MFTKADRKAFAIGGAIGAIVIVAFWIGVIVTAAHYIAKFW